MRVFIVCEANYSYQFNYFIKRGPDENQSEERADRKRRMRKEMIINVTYFIYIVHFLIFEAKILIQGNEFI